MKTQIKYPELSASDLTAFALEMLRLKRYRVRRVNNVGVYKKRANQVEPGWPDVQGYTDRGLACLVEIKKNGDKLSDPQIERLTDCHECGGVALICYQKNGNAELIDFVDYWKPKD
jgi:hypothetical protein